MMLVEVKVAPSHLHGLGLFACNDIQKGTPVWEFTPGFDIIVPVTELHSLDDRIQNIVKRYGYKNKEAKYYVLCFDNARFINHSEEPNIVSNQDDQEKDYALRDIRAGEEILVNYKEFDDDYIFKLTNSWLGES